MEYNMGDDKIIGIVSSIFDKQIESYYIHEKSGQYALLNEEGKCLLNYVPRTKELYYDYSMSEFTQKFIPFIDIDIFKEGAKKYFKTQFPKMQIRAVHGANIV